jgi:hypothetical protein
MSRTFRRLTFLLGAVALVAPAVVAAQPGQGPPPAGTARRPMAPQGAVARQQMPSQMPSQMSRQMPMAATRLLNARRALDLTPRQVAQLDSIERVEFAQRRQLGEQMRAMRDSMMRAQGATMRPGMSPGMSRDSMQARMAPMRSQMEALRPQMDQMRKRDSASRVAAERVLTDAQRQKVREMQAEERGRQRGLREARQGQRQGMRQGRRQGMRQGQRQGRGMRGPQGSAVRPPQAPGMRGGMTRPSRPPVPPQPIDRD